MSESKYVTIIGSPGDFPIKKHIRTGDRLLLVSDDENKDPYAVLALAEGSSSGNAAGYVSADSTTTLEGCINNKDLKDYILEHGVLYAKVVEILEHPDNLILKAAIEAPENCDWDCSNCQKAIQYNDF